MKNNLAYEYIKQVIQNERTAGDGYYTEKCQSWLEEKMKSNKILMTTSCTHALELVFQLLSLNNYEVIMPSYTFPSTANAVLLNGGQVVFTEVDPKNLCIDVNRIEEKITKKTKAIIVVHYGGNSCNMNKIMDIAKRHSLYVIEDAAQGLLSTYNNQYLGTIGHFGCFSFHETKNISCGEGGAISINVDDPKLIEKAEIIRQKGTNRSAFDKGMVSRYEWVGSGSSYSPSELLMAYLYAQLQISDSIHKTRRDIFKSYEHHFRINNYSVIEEFSKGNAYGDFNAHIFYIIFKQEQQATQFINQLSEENIKVSTHFVPLHLSELGRKMGYQMDSLSFEATIHKRLVRLPINTRIEANDMEAILNKIHTALMRL